MENHIKKLEAKLQQADAHRTKTPSPAVWGRIASQLDQPKVQPVRKLFSDKWYKMAAAIALVLSISIVVIYTIDRQSQNESWTACTDCVERLDEQPFMASLPIAGSTRSLYQPFTRAVNGNGIYSSTERLSAPAAPKAVNISHIIETSISFQSENNPAIFGSWKSSALQKQGFMDIIRTNAAGEITWQRTNADGQPLFSGRSIGYAQDIFQMQINFGNVNFTTDAYFKDGCLLIDLTAVNGRFYRWLAKPDQSALFTAIFPMYSYTSLAAGGAERYGEQNVVLAKK